MRGREELSRPFAFEVVVEPTDGILILDDFEAIMDGTATISFGADREHPIHGVVRQIEILPAEEADRVSYRFSIVPRFADTQLTRGSWIYQEATPEAMIEKALSEILPEGARLTRGEHFDFELDGSYNPREYVVQYEESIFNFVSRQAEHWGIFYFFDHLGEKEKLVFADANSKFPQLEGFESVLFDSRLGAIDERECVVAISARQRKVAHQISLREYNYRTPSVPLPTPLAPVDAAGIGDVHLSGEHYWTPAEGNALAQVRGQEIFGRKLRMAATSRVRGLRAGHRFGLVGDTPELLGLAREYLVVAVEHSFAADGPDGASGAGQYRNHLTLAPYEAVFRPDRFTPKPRIYGVTHATIDAESADDGISAPVDGFGRYKVVMPWDVAGATGGRATCWIRLATPASGGSWGFAQQIHTGQEVAIYHVDGDPDRPIIAGSLPNFQNPSVVTSQNANVSTFATRGGIGFRMRDT
jgi:type VI secretion system VgrG family protein